MNTLILKIRQGRIRKKIEKGSIKLIQNICLKDNWIYHPLIQRIRENVIPVVEDYLKQGEILFDPQDLEHQILFRMTTFSPRQLFGEKIGDYLKHQIKDWQDIENIKIENLNISQKILKQISEEQYLIIEKRMKEVGKTLPIAKVFRGLSGQDRDLNRFNRLRLERRHGGLVAAGSDGYQREVEFRKIDDRDLTSLLIGDFHYIHSERSKGAVFAFFFKEEEIPWGIETTEKSCYSRHYKRLALLANGIHPDRAIELTRYYTLPGSPRNSMSVIDGLVRNYYAPTNIEALMTCVMPTYAKTKSSTIAGGINQLLSIKPTTHRFIKEEINGRMVWRHVTKRLIAQLGYKGTILLSHPDFPLYPTFEVYVIIKKESTFKKLPELEDKVISFL